MVALQVVSPLISETDILAMTLDNPPGEILKNPLRLRLGEILFHARRFEVVARTRRDVEGFVHDAGSGQPLADWQIVVTNGFDRFRMERLEVRTDEVGRYRVPRYVAHAVDISVVPPSGQPYPTGQFMAEAGPTLDAVVVNFDARRLPLLRGWITDAATGQSVVGTIQDIALPGNLNLNGYRGFDPRRGISKAVSDDGTFALPVLAGPSLVTFYARDPGHFRPWEGAEHLPGYDPRTQRVPIAYHPLTRRKAGDIDPPSILTTKPNFVVAIQADLATPLASLDYQLEPVPRSRSRSWTRRGNRSAPPGSRRPAI